MATFLKDPPSFVKNIGAWEYTLAKLRNKQEDDGKRRLDEGGNPLNYGQAVAIYKAVVRKYPHLATENVTAQPVKLGGEKMFDDSATVVELDDAFPVGQMFWYDDVLLEAVGHPNIAVYSEPDGHLKIWGKVLDVDPEGQHRNLPEGRQGGWPPHRCVPFAEEALV